MNRIIIAIPYTSIIVQTAGLLKEIFGEENANYEQKLINEYNAANLGVYGGSKSSDEAKAKIASYKDFLAARATLKAQIDADCAELNIE